MNAPQNTPEIWIVVENLGYGERNVLDADGIAVYEGSPGGAVAGYATLEDVEAAIARLKDGAKYLGDLRAERVVLG